MKSLNEYLNEGKEEQTAFDKLPEFSPKYNNLVNQIQDESKANFKQLIKDRFDSNRYTAKNLFANQQEEVLSFELYDNKTNEVYHIKSDRRNGSKKDKMLVTVQSGTDYDPSKDVFTQVRGDVEKFEFSRDDLKDHRKYYTKSGSHFTWGVAYMSMALDYIKKNNKELKIK